MYNKNLKSYKQFISNYILFEDVNIKDYESKIKIDTLFKKRYERLFFDYLLMMDVVDDKLYESVEDVALKIHTNEWEKDANAFHDSFMMSKRVEYLTPYTIDELKEFDVYKLKGYNIGFAIKKDGDIILVHNNDKIKGIGDLLIKKAIQYGGIKLDHFDGFLTGFYKRNGFEFNGNDHFVEKYAPDNWNYKPVDIDNPKTSIYADELEIVNEKEYEKAKDRYEEGKPDVVYRKV